MDKLIDINVWKELYAVLKRISINYDATSPPFGPQMIDKNRYKLTFKRIEMNAAHIRDVFNVDVELIHDVLGAHLLLNNDDNETLVATPVNAQVQLASESSRINFPNADKNVSNSVGQHNAKRILNEFESSPDSEDSSSVESPALKKRNILQPGSASKINIVYTSSDSSSIESSSVDTADDQWNIDSRSLVNVDIPDNLQDLSKLMKDSKYMNRFGYGSDGQKNRLYDNVYFTDDGSVYAAFHAAKVSEKFRGAKNCTLSFYFSQELLQQFNSFSSVRFKGVNHVLMVFVRNFFLGTRPFGFFLLPDRLESLANVPAVVNRWLNQCSTEVTKCVTPYDPILQRSVAAIWPTAKLIGCSAEYQNEIKDFAKKNKGLGAEHKTKLTRLAWSLCYLDEKYFSIGIDLIEKHSVSEYGANLVQHLRTKWVHILKSVHREQIVCRSLNICQRVSKQIERDYFTSSLLGTKTHTHHRHVWEFILFLKTLESTTAFECFRALGNAPDNFGCSTELQKEREIRYLRASEELDENLKILPESKAVEQFMLRMLLNK